MKNVLVVSGHPELENESVANKNILNNLEKLMPNAEFDYLDKLYSDFNIDIKDEQSKLQKSDVIVLQFPIWWYSIPSLMQRWFEQTFQHGFSHGSSGNELKNKKIILSFTSGASKEMYKKDGFMKYSVNELLSPLYATANLCGMKIIGEVYTDNVSYLARDDSSLLEDTKERTKEHAEKVVDLIEKA
ncbi:NAD(P)H-dependent oxidoreductase [Apilactobacillus quenuiae]|uniref:NAD(P)H-dependent oxidoreductase n=1 Tax=Apilactobacillus quenuiae TaxID=2008377 RepID=UPI000D011EED|nr:NAD(P)H-dependent oxidoreductase [Apilactobacillus quenuiae]